MMVTIRQKIQVAKDRALDELGGINDEAHGYWNMDRKTRRRVFDIARFLHMPDMGQATLDAADRLGFINGDEGMFFDKDGAA